MFWQDHQEKIEDETDSSKNRKKNEDAVINQNHICGLSTWSYSYLLIRDDCLDALDVCILLMSWSCDTSAENGVSTHEICWISIH